MDSTISGKTMKTNNIGGTNASYCNVLFYGKLDHVICQRLSGAMSKKTKQN